MYKCDLRKNIKGSPLIEALILFPAILLFTFTLTYAIIMYIHTNNLEGTLANTVRTSISESTLQGAMDVLKELDIDEQEIISIKIYDQENYTTPIKVYDSPDFLITEEDEELWRIGNMIEVSVEKSTGIGNLVKFITHIRLPDGDQVELVASKAYATIKMHIENDSYEG